MTTQPETRLTRLGHLLDALLVSVQRRHRELEAQGIRLRARPRRLNPGPLAPSRSAAPFGRAMW